MAASALGIAAVWLLLLLLLLCCRLLLLLLIIVRGSAVWPPAAVATRCGCRHYPAAAALGTRRLKGRGVDLEPKHLGHVVVCKRAVARPSRCVRCTAWHGQRSVIPQLTTKHSADCS